MKRVIYTEVTLYRINTAFVGRLMEKWLMLTSEVKPINTRQLMAALNSVRHREKLSVLIHCFTFLLQINPPSVVDNAFKYWSQ